MLPVRSDSDSLCNPYVNLSATEKFIAACILDGTISVRCETPTSHQQELIICLGMMNWLVFT